MRRIRANIARAYDQTATRVGLGLAAAAAAVVAEHQRRLNVSNPPPHKTPSRPGQYPRKRTGFGQANVLYVPTSPVEIGRQGYVDVGIGEQAFYLDVLVGLGRKGIDDTAADMQRQIEDIIARVASRGS